jgi:hypothetical protein
MNYLRQKSKKVHIQFDVAMQIVANRGITVFVCF